ncbi:MAG TPA: 30S ribosomal protein S6e [Methanomicrobiales archaeon]|jgi:small subunit ribosomal protein S6e|nr:30S ribosomal protein S6e [Methanomicrobiales archaeon]
MVDFKLVLSDTKDGRAYNVSVSGGSANAFIGKRIGDEVDGGPVGLGGYKMKITGGSDRNGNPMRRDLPGMARRRLLLSGGVGFHPRLEGERRRKMTRGNEITPDLVQINALVTGYGEKPLGEYFKKGEEKPAEKETPARKERPAKKK